MKKIVTNKLLKKCATTLLIKTKNVNFIVHFLDANYTQDILALNLKTDPEKDVKGSAIISIKAEEQNDDQYDQNIKTKILSASLPFVNEFGWSKETLVKGAESIGYPGISHGLFPNGGAELVHFFYSDCNKKLADTMKQVQQHLSKVATELNGGKLQETTNKDLIVPKFINKAVENRLRMIVPYKQWWPQAIAIMSLPPNVRQTLENLKTLADDICYYAGDRSVDFSWYARRFAVAGLYKTTELYMMQDKSDDHNKTWEFLNRRVEELFQIHDLLHKTESVSNKSPEIIQSVYTTLGNILRT